ncbi:MAG: hypothetical protein GY937_23225, partial [bacterium]|nr:hypothetical protein [bacterium]
MNAKQINKSTLAELDYLLSIIDWNCETFTELAEAVWLRLEQLSNNARANHGTKAFWNMVDRIIANRFYMDDADEYQIGGGFELSHFYEMDPVNHVHVKWFALTGAMIRIRFRNLKDSPDAGETF